MASFKGILGSILRRRKRSISETLEEIDLNIAMLKEYKAVNVSRASKIVFHLIFYASLLYITVVMVSYFLIRPSDTQWQIVFIIFVVSFPLLICLLRYLVNLMYMGSADRADKKLKALMKEKRKTLEEAMSTETFNKVQQLLKRFDPLSLIVRDESTQFASGNDKYEIETNARLRRVGNPTGDSQTVPQTPKLSTPPATAEPSTVFPAKGPITHRPILPRHRSILHVILDAIVGDGPNHRYALICQQCAGHNGMALAEEFEYIAFRCCYCGFHNPAHRVRRPLLGLPSVGASGNSPVSSSAESTPFAPRRLQSTSALNLTSAEHLKSIRISSSTGDVAFAEVLPSSPSRESQRGPPSPHRHRKMRSTSFSPVSNFPVKEKGHEHTKN